MSVWFLLTRLLFSCKISLRGITAGNKCSVDEKRYTTLGRPVGWGYSPIAKVASVGVGDGLGDGSFTEGVGERIECWDASMKF